jgi:Tfp pilus assembly protein FimT
MVENLQRHFTEERNSRCPSQAISKSGERGASIIEILIVIAMTSVVAGFAIIQIAVAQRSMRLTNAARELMGWFEKARLDSLRRHPMSNGEMASITLASNNTYTVVIDRDGDGTLDQPLTITIPGTNGVSFSGVTIPTTVRFNWRGRPVDSSGNLMTLSFSLQDPGGNVSPVPINLTSSGDTSLGSNVNANSVSVPNIDESANIKKKTWP